MAPAIVSSSAIDVLSGVNLTPAPVNKSVALCNRIVVFSGSDDERRVQPLAAEEGCTFESGRGGHLIVRRGDRMSVLPMHGKQKELGTGLVNSIKKDLGLK